MRWTGGAAAICAFKPSKADWVRMQQHRIEHCRAGGTYLPRVQVAGQAPVVRRAAVE